MILMILSFIGNLITMPFANGSYSKIESKNFGAIHFALKYTLYKLDDSSNKRKKWIQQKMLPSHSKVSSIYYPRQLPSGLIFDDPGVKSFQYHCFSACLLGEIYRMTDDERVGRETHSLSFTIFSEPEISGTQMRDGPDSPEIKFSDRREALELMTQIESTVTSLHREAEAQFRPELEKIVSGIETGCGTALYATENIAGRINTRLEDEGFTVKISFPAVSQLQTRLAVKTNLSALMEERTETVTRRRRQSGLWGKDLWSVWHQ